MKHKILKTIIVSALVMSFVLPSFAWEGTGKAAEGRSYDGRFTDVSSTDWFYEGVVNAYELGLMDGTASENFSPGSSITIAQTITLAVKINCRYTTESAISLDTSGSEGSSAVTDWFAPYLNYAVAHGIVDDNQYAQPGKAATRREFAEILSHSLPDDAFTAINAVDDGDIWDLKEQTASNQRIYLLYNAGIISGSDEYGGFYPDRTIKRSEAAIIAARIADPSLRFRFTLEEKPEVPASTVTKLGGKTYCLPAGSKYTFDATGRDGQPYLVMVNRQCCTVTVYGKDTDGDYTVPVKAFVCSVGRKGHGTPTGRWNTTDKYEWRIMVDGTYGRYAIRFAPGGYLFHSVPYYSKNKSDLEYTEYNKLGEPASLGCVRMSVADVKWLYDNCPSGFTTIVYDDPSPGPLGKPSAVRTDVSDEAKRGWDPTDPDPANPWNLTK